MTIDEQSMKAAFDLVYAAREVTDPDELGPVILAGLGPIVPSEVVSFNEVDPGAGRVVFLVEPSTFTVPAGSEDTLNELMAEHPLISHMMRTGDGSARRITDVWSEQEWHDSRIYRELYRQLGVEHQMSIALPGAAPVFVGIALNRARDPFDDDDVTLLDLIRPHLAQSWRQAREHRRLRSLLHSASDALTESGSQVILLSDPPHELTDGALIELFRFFGRPSPTGSLPARVGRWVERQRSAHRHAEAGELLRPLQASLAEHRLVLRFLPAADGHADAILLRTEDAGGQSGRLATLGLSSREIDVVELLITGVTNAEIAAQLHIAASTVKKHLDSVYAKVGVSGRGRVTAALTEILAHQAVT